MMYHFFFKHPKLIKQGEIHLKSPHYQSFNFDPENEAIHGRVKSLASFHDEIHSTLVSIILHGVKYIYIYDFLKNLVCVFKPNYISVRGLPAFFGFNHLKLFLKTDGLQIFHTINLI